MVSTPPLSLTQRIPTDLRTAIETPLTLVRTESPSLEDAYLEIVARAEGPTDG